MLVDGIHALIGGSYIGDSAGRLGPWASVVSAVGISPGSQPMKAAFVVFGAAYVVAAALYVIRSPMGSTAVTVVAVATLWYVPVGTLLSVLTLLALFAISRTGVRAAKTRKVPPDTPRG